MIAKVHLHRYHPLECKRNILNEGQSPRGVGDVQKATPKSCDALPACEARGRLRQSIRLERTLLESKVELQNPHKEVHPKDRPA